LVLHHGLADDIYGPGGTYDACFAGTARPDVIVPLSGCHYEYAGNHFGFDASGWTNEDANLVLIAGENDGVCEAWQSRDAATVLETAGYDVGLTTIADADHLSVIFYDYVEGSWRTDPQHPAGQQVVETIVEAIEAATP
jgi:hypothetical protein